MIKSDEYIVDIPMCTYNHEKFLGEAIESVLMQKCDFKFRLFVGEDCSKDNTRQVLKSYADKYPDIIFPIYHPENVGASLNTKILLSKCTAKYISFLDGDDYWLTENKLQRQVDFLEQNPDCIASHHWQKVAVLDKDGNYIVQNAPTDGHGYFPFDKSGVENIFANKLRIKSRTVLFRNVISPLPEWYYKVNYGDVAISMALGKHGKFGFINEPMALYRQTGKGLSSDGKGHWSFFLKHYIEWIRVWEYGNNYYNAEYQKEALNTICYFYNVIFEKYHYSIRILASTLKYALFESQLSYFLRFEIAWKLFKYFFFSRNK